jgi:rhodanese-related sulfurtransferase
MAHTPHDFLDAACRVIPEVSVEAVAARRTHGNEVILLDVREHEEVRTGSIEGAIYSVIGSALYQSVCQARRLLGGKEAHTIVFGTI